MALTKHEKKALRRYRILMKPAALMKEYLSGCQVSQVALDKYIEQEVDDYMTYVSQQANGCAPKVWIDAD